MTSFIPLPQPIERRAILRKREGLLWEGDGVTNPGVVRLGNGTIAVLYRGCGSDKNSYLGFCLLDENGREVIEGSRPLQPLTLADDAFPEGFSDPRINQVGEQYYIFANGRNDKVLKENRAEYDNDFSAYYSGGRQTVALRTLDFQEYEYLGEYGPDVFDKNSFLHPGPLTINGVQKVAMFHRVQYNIQVAIADKIEDFHDKNFWRDYIEHLNEHTFARPLFSWEGVGLTTEWPGSIAGGAPPLKVGRHFIPQTLDQQKQYWVLFYNASGAPRDGTIAEDRNIGALIYCLKDNFDADTQVFDVVARTPSPILVAQESYEMNAGNGNIVFVTGALETRDGSAIDIFYGSGDKVASKARFMTSELLDYLFQFDAEGKRRST